MIINSLLDTDFYKFSMGQAVFHQFSNTMVSYHFNCRNKKDLSFNFFESYKTIKEEIDHFLTLRFTEDEISYLRSLDIFKEDYLTFLKSLNFSSIKVDFHCSLPEGELYLYFSGSWKEAIYLEVPFLSIINEVYNHQHSNPNYSEARFYLDEKIEFLQSKKIHFTEFGTRRRFSKYWQEHIVNELFKAKDHYSRYNAKFNFLGTSNVLLSKEHNSKPVGTLAHEWLMAGQRLAEDLEHFQSEMLVRWLVEYHDVDSFSLTDTLTTDVFLKDFNSELAHKFKGLRQDSGDPIIWGNKILDFYHERGIDPKEKTLIFSDGLNIEKIIAINEVFENKTNIVFGIGTNLTNDFPDILPLQIVIKLAIVDGLSVVKISDTPGKVSFLNSPYTKDLQRIFKI